MSARTLGQAATATFHFFTNQTAWQAVVTDPVNINFNWAAVDSLDDVPVPPGLTMSNVNFSIDEAAHTGQMGICGPLFFYPRVGVLSSAYSFGPQNFLITLPAGVHALALDIGDLTDAGGDTIGFSLSTGNTFTATTFPYNGIFPSTFTFVGLTSDTPISSLEITDITGSTSLNLEDFSYGLINVPEPASACLLACALIGFALRNPRRGEAGGGRRHDAKNHCENTEPTDLPNRLSSNIV